MSDDGSWEFAIDPSLVRKVGTEDLPEIAEGLREARRWMLDTEVYWHRTFHEDQTPLESMYSTTEERWGSACSSFVSSLFVAATRIDRAAEGLVNLVDDCLTVDNASADQLAAILDRDFGIEQEEAD